MSELVYLPTTLGRFTEVGLYGQPFSRNISSAGRREAEIQESSSKKIVGEYVAIIRHWDVRANQVYLLKDCFVVLIEFAGTHDNLYSPIH